VSLVETERVLVVPTELLHRLGYFQGFTADTDRYLDELLCPANMTYRSRGEMEQDPSHKQLIPYVILRHFHPEAGETVFQYRRGKGQGERRLHSKRSVGIGGHICVDDETSDQDLHPYEEGMRRELAEEVDIRTPFTQRLVGLINDDKTDVGRVHLGVVHLFDVETPQVVPRERDIMEAGFRPVAGLLAELDDFESWSRICLEALFAGPSTVTPHNACSVPECGH
jgi:predicted NUDIX family phosphoesterase